MNRIVTLAVLIALAVGAGGCCLDELRGSARTEEVSAARPALRERLVNKVLELGLEVFIRIFKKERRLEVWVDKDGRFELFSSYPICRFSGEPGPKLAEGDRQAPEGFYFVPREMLNPHSRHHLAFNLGFPNAYDRAHGRTGSFLMVHGGCSSIGCYAMTDKAIEEIYTLVEGALAEGQPYVRVHIFPFRMTGKNMRRHARSKWYPFWKNLEEGYRIFEKEKRPPSVEVEDGRYTFEST